MTPARWLLLAGIVPTSLVLDAYWSCYALMFAWACAESGNAVPPTFAMFTIASLVLTALARPFRSTRAFGVMCLSAVVLHGSLQLYLVADSLQSGLNCYRDVGTGLIAAAVLYALFFVALLAISAAFGVVRLTRIWLAR